jgi:hypothetical protein
VRRAADLRAREGCAVGDRENAQPAIVLVGEDRQAPRADVRQRERRRRAFGLVEPDRALESDVRARGNAGIGDIVFPLARDREDDPESADRPRCPPHVGC